jgi:hypothetical protein
VTDPGKFVIHLGDASEKTPLQGELTINYQERGTHKQKGLPSDFGRPFPFGEIETNRYRDRHPSLACSATE